MTATATPPVALPKPRGPISELVVELLQTSPGEAGAESAPERLREALDAVGDPLTDDDLHLALYSLYALHYRAFEGVDLGWEWDPRALGIRQELENLFWHGVRDRMPDPGPADPASVGSALFEIEAADEGASLSAWIQTRADEDQFREFMIHRSAYQLKEADPHSWQIPRLTGGAKSSMLEVQYDEYGSGRAERMHSLLFANAMRALGLDTKEDGYLDCLPGATLATVNLISFFGLHGRNRGLLVGHLAMYEMGSSKANRAYGNALRRLGFGAEALDFFDEHVEADAIHENIAAHDMAGGLARQEPALAGDILLGARSLLFLDGISARRIIDCWEAGGTSLFDQGGWTA